MYRKHPGFVKSVFLGVRASCKAWPIYLAGHTLQSLAYISRLDLSQRTLRCKSA